MWNLKCSIAGAVGRSQKIQPIALLPPRQDSLLRHWRQFASIDPSQKIHQDSLLRQYPTAQKTPDYVMNCARAKEHEPFRQLQVNPNPLNLSSTIYENLCNECFESFIQMKVRQKQGPYSGRGRPFPRRSFPKSTKPTITKERAQLTHSNPVSYTLLEGSVQGNVPEQNIERTSPETNISRSTRPRRSFTKDKSYKTAQEPLLESSESVQEKPHKIARIKSNSTIRSAHSKTLFKRKHSVGSMSLKSVDLLKILRKMSAKRPKEKEHQERNDLDSAAKPLNPATSTSSTQKEVDPTNSIFSKQSSTVVSHDSKQHSSISCTNPSNKYNLPDFLPINIMQHKDEFLSVHSLEQNFKDTMPKIWPRAEPEISRQTKKEESMTAKNRSEGDQAKRLLRLKTRKAVGCQTKLSSPADCSYQCDVCHKGGGYSYLSCHHQPARDSQQHRKQKRRRHEVACQTVPTICGLCQIAQQPEPDEPYMTAMKRRRQREDLLVYYRQMDRPKQSPAPNKSQSKRSLQHMRTQLELYLEILGHCDRVVDDKLHARIQNFALQC